MTAKAKLERMEDAIMFEMSQRGSTAHGGELKLIEVCRELLQRIEVLERAAMEARS